MFFFYLLLVIVGIMAFGLAQTAGRHTPKQKKENPPSLEEQRGDYYMARFENDLKKMRRIK